MRQTYSKPTTETQETLVQQPLLEGSTIEVFAKGRLRESSPEEEEWEEEEQSATSPWR